MDLNKVGTPSFNQKENNCTFIDRNQNNTPVMKEVLVQPSIIFNQVKIIPSVPKYEYEIDKQNKPVF